MMKIWLINLEINVFLKVFSLLEKEQEHLWEWVFINNNVILLLT